MESESRKYRIWMALAICHLFLVLLGASYVDLSSIILVGKPLGYYGALSGAGNSYGFFAPGISGQLRAQFDVVDSRGIKKTVPLTSWNNHEAELRVGNIIDQFGDDEDDDDDEDGQSSESLHRTLAASLAGTVFGRHPEAKQVAVRFEEFLPVSMKAYRGGARGGWSPLYAAKFERARKEASR